MSALTQYLEKLIRFKTISGLESQTETLELFNWVYDQIPNKKYSSEIIESNGFNNLIVKDRNQREKEIVLLAHIDVVPGPEEIFKPTIKNNLLFGRGASDMKFAVAVFIKLLNEPYLNKYSLKLILTSDEEIGGSNGVQKLHTKGVFNNSEFILLPDAGKNFEIISKAKGVVHFKLDAFGKNSHASKPFEGVNAFDMLFKQYQILLKVLDIDNSANWANTFVISKMSGGDVVNQVPDSASMWLDLRFTEKHSCKDILKLINSNLIEGVKLDVLVTGEPVYVDTSKNIFKILEKNVKKHTGNEISYEVDYGSTDARHIVDLNVPVIMIKPDAGGHHTKEEWINIGSLEEYFVVVKNTIIDFDKI